MCVTCAAVPTATTLAAFAVTAFALAFGALYLALGAYAALRPAHRSAR